MKLDQNSAMTRISEFKKLSTVFYKLYKRDGRRRMYYTINELEEFGDVRIRENHSNALCTLMTNTYGMLEREEGSRGVYRLSESGVADLCATFEPRRRFKRVSLEDQLAAFDDL